MTSPVTIVSLLVVVVELWSTHAQTANAMTANPLYVYAQCIIERDIPPIDSESNILLKTTFEMLQTYTSLSYVLNCVNSKLADLKMSDNPLNRYIGYAFDLNEMNTSLMAASDIYQSYKGSACLRDKVAPTQLDCLLNQTLKFSNTSNDICSINTTPCKPVHSTPEGCSSEDMLFASVSSVLFYGKCLSYATFPGNDTIPSSTPSIEPLPMPFLETTLLFECITQYIARNDVGFLFPPSERTSSIPIDTVTAMRIHKATVESFCSNLTSIKACMRSSNRVKSPLDRALYKLMQGSLKSFDIYCFIQSVVTPEYECTLRNTKTHICNGGVFGVIDTIGAHLNMTSGDINFHQICDIVDSTQKCRLQNQISPCGNIYEKNMRAFYENFSVECNQNKPLDKNMGEAILCFGPLVERIKEASLKEPLSKDSTPADAVKFWMHMFCSSRTEWIPCLHGVYKNVTNPIDKIIFSVQIPDNIEIISDFICSKEDEFKENIGCLMTTMIDPSGQLDGNLRPCLMKALPDFVYRLNSGGDLQSLIANMSTDAFTTEMCSAMKPMAACLKPKVAECDADFAESYMAVVSKFSAGCNNPNKISQQKNSGQTKLSANIIYYVFLSVFFFFS